MRPVAALDGDPQTSDNSQITWLHSDHLLTARVATDSDQNLIWRWRSDAFGVGQAENLAADGAVHNDEAVFTFNLRFPGQYYDAENGLHYNYFRTYDPQQGRYTQSDPIGLLGGVNTFAYAGSSPLHFIDWFGLAVNAVFDTAAQMLTITDSDSGESIFVETFSGAYIDIEGEMSGAGRSPYLPIPKGEYYIVDNPSPNSDSTWFGLFYKDDRIDDYAIVDGVERSGMRLHGGSVSHGCVTVSDYHATREGYSSVERQGPEAWVSVRNFILSTKVSELEYIRGPHFWNPKDVTTLYGTLIVR